MGAMFSLNSDLHNIIFLFALLLHLFLALHLLLNKLKENLQIKGINKLKGMEMIDLVDNNLNMILYIEEEIKMVLQLQEKNLIKDILTI